jgi:hypothetical protein
MVTGKIWTSGNKELDMDLTQSVWNDWAPKISLTTFIPGWPILMQSSFGGDSSYVPGDAANKQIVEGYEHVPSQPLIFGRWLGWA